ncbi:hypothetical protein HPB50_023092 [Hyalomma asiaticum]|uniref:Uncharacterized protein n=1 Tax=Hyalomma asiaticum TaxID=266040 RepID=A0ACB7TRX9_HYAAI|nr:hypothetical protein HPB50_023092 [Hyalomma asiaticum]
MGARIATDLAKFGATVIAIDLDGPKLAELQKQVSNIIRVAVDLSDWDATERALANVGDVDLLVNNAGITKLEAIGEIRPDTIDKIFSVNFKAAVNISQICVRSMKSRGVPGAVVNVSSQSGLVALPEHAVYCGSKAALDMLTRVMALELGPYNVGDNS